MLRASNRIEHGYKDKDGKNIVIVLEAGQPAKGLPADAVSALQACGAVYDDRAANGEPASEG